MTSPPKVNVEFWEFETAMPSVVASLIVVTPVTAKVELSTLIRLMPRVPAALVVALSSWTLSVPPELDLDQAARAVERDVADVERADRGGQRVGDVETGGVADREAGERVAARERDAAACRVGDGRVGAGGCQRGAADDQRRTLTDQV